MRVFGDTFDDGFQLGPRTAVPMQMTTCDQCGTPLNPEGWCPKCLLDLAATAGAPPGPPGKEEPGVLIDRYKLLEKLGEGGFGVVWAAEQTEPVKRRVAIKIIKLGMDTRQVVARFEAERQALALMDHPNIARVHDAGATAAGRPYFAMELVRGIPITDYCDQERLSTQARVELFMKVCHAIQHAHQKGIIHRDIKPANVMVTMQDAVAVPKVIDFGIAKATQMELTEKTIYSQLHQFIGTPAYMSPEQAEMNGLDIDTRSDIYSLGVLLYELMTGHTPFEPQELRTAGIDAIRRIIREKEPLRPSTKLAVLNPESLGLIAQRHSSTAPALIQRLKGDLDWIAIRCLEKDRTRRYETANGLAADLKRHLQDEPVVARPPSTAYRMQKAFRRNVVAFSAVGAVALSLVIGFAVSTWQAAVATQARLGERQARLAAEGARRTAENEQARAERNGAASQAMTEIFRNMVDGLLHLAKQSDQSAPFLALLNQAGTNAQHAFAQHPVLAAEVYQLVGLNLYHAGRPNQAAHWLWTAYECQKNNPELVQTVAFARLLMVLSGSPGLHNGNLVGLAREGQEILRHQLPDGDPLHAQARIAVAFQLRAAGRLEEAEQEARSAIAALKALPQNAFPANLLARGYQELAEVLFAQSHFPEAAETYSLAVETSRSAGSLETHLLIYLEIGTARSYMRAGRIDPAKRHADSAGKLVHEHFGSAHPVNCDVNDILVEIADRRKDGVQGAQLNQKGLQAAATLAADQPERLGTAIRWLVGPLDHGAFGESRRLLLGWLGQPHVVARAPAGAWTRAGEEVAKHAPWHGPQPLREAALLFAQARRSDRSSPAPWLFGLACLAALQDGDGLVRDWPEAVTAMAQQQGSHLDGYLPKMLLLLPAQPILTSHATALLRQARTNRSEVSQPWLDSAEALVAYRTGEYALASQLATRAYAATAVTSACQVSGYAIQALADYRQGNTAEAARHLAVAKARARAEDPWVRREASTLWADWAIARVVLQEAAETIP